MLSAKIGEQRKQVTIYIDLNTVGI